MQKEEDETIFYTHNKQALTNERMKLNIITKVKEVRRRTGSACGVISACT